MKIIYFYKYVGIEDPESLQEEQLELCKSLELKGRVFLDREGINGTLSGSDGNIKKYEENLKNNNLFHDIEFKEEKVNGHCFKKIFVRVRKEIVNFSGNINLKNSGNKISAKEFNNLIENEDIVILDARNNYETMIGKFKNAIDLDLDNFRDFPKKLDRIKHLKDKKIVTYCTGGG